MSASSDTFSMIRPTLRKGSPYLRPTRHICSSRPRDSPANHLLPATHSNHLGRHPTSCVFESMSAAKNFSIAEIVEGKAVCLFYDLEVWNLRRTLFLEDMIMWGLSREKSGDEP
jgi:hypothetical protein